MKMTVTFNDRFEILACLRVGTFSTIKSILVVYDPWEGRTLLEFLIEVTTEPKLRTYSDVYFTFSCTEALPRKKR